MTIDWANTAVYNTIMAVSVGVALVLVARFFNKLRLNQISHLDGWFIAFLSLGFILTLTGAHMSLTWPLSKIGFAFDDIIFGEPSLAFGVLLIAFSILLWRRSNIYMKKDIDMSNKELISEKLKEELPDLIRPLSFFGSVMGAALIAIGIAGITFQLFAAPPEEPISGQFADYPMVEATFMSALIALIGIGAIMLPFMIKQPFDWSVFKSVKFVFYLTGIVLIAFGVINYFTHIGLIVNTME